MNDSHPGRRRRPWQARLLAALPLGLLLLALLAGVAADLLAPVAQAGTLQPAGQPLSAQEFTAAEGSGAGESAPGIDAQRRTPTPRPRITATPTPTRRPTVTATPTRRARATPTPTRAGRQTIDGIPVIHLDELPPEAIDTLILIGRGGPYPYGKDGSVFQNREGILPQRPRGYYREYTVITPWEDDRGARRIVAGEGDEFYYTDDHYDSFKRIVE
jgi:ribonuclease T1